MARILWEIGDVFFSQKEDANGVVVSDNYAIVVRGNDRKDYAIAKERIPEDAFPISGEHLAFEVKMAIGAVRKAIQ